MSAGFPRSSPGIALSRLAFVRVWGVPANIPEFAVPTVNLDNRKLPGAVPGSFVRR
jgi:hypothetical protein